MAQQAGLQNHVMHEQQVRLEQQHQAQQLLMAQAHMEQRCQLQAEMAQHQALSDPYGGMSESSSSGSQATAHPYSSSSSPCGLVPFILVNQAH